jgi:hypothetical protein
MTDSLTRQNLISFVSRIASCLDDVIDEGVSCRKPEVGSSIIA